MPVRKIAVLLFSLFFLVLACEEAPDPSKEILSCKVPNPSKACQDEPAPQKYALLISGVSEMRHRDNLSLALKTLLRNGFDPSNIYILDCKGRNRKRYAVDCMASRKNIQIAFGCLKGIMTERDLLFIYTTDHGGYERRPFLVDGQRQTIKVSTLSIPTREKDIDEIEFAKLINTLKFRTGVFVFDQCFSGGFAKRSAGKGRITISACRNNESSLDASFPHAFFGAFEDKTADTDQSGQVSIKEAYGFALKHDRHTARGNQRPQMFDGIKSEVFLK